MIDADEVADAPVIAGSMTNSTCWTSPSRSRVMTSAKSNQPTASHTQARCKRRGSQSASPLQSAMSRFNQLVC
jgi:hypothetical protein